MVQFKDKLQGKDKSEKGEPRPPAIRQAALVPASIIYKETVTKADDVDIPEFLKGQGMVEAEAPTGFPPTVDFQDRPGSWIVGKYLGQRSDVGPNESMIYELDVPTLGVVSIWGSTVLDRKMESLRELQPGKYLFIEYLGKVPSKQGQPAKDYRVLVISAPAFQAAQMAMASIER